MTVQYVDFERPITALAGQFHINIKPEQMKVKARAFYDDTWRGLSKGVITHHLSHSETMMEPSHGYVSTVLSAGYMFVVCYGLSYVAPTNAINQFVGSPSNMMDALEVQTGLEIVYNDLPTNVAIAQFFEASQRTVITGSGRLATACIKWSSLSVNQFTDFRGKVISFLVDSPLGSNLTPEEGRRTQTYSEIRSMTMYLNSAAHFGRLLFAVLDTQRNPRSLTERLATSTANRAIQFNIVGGDSTYSHNWTNVYPQEFMQYAVADFENLNNQI